MTFSVLLTLKAGTGWVAVVITLTANSSLTSESSKRRVMIFFLTCFGKIKKSGGRERLLWFLVFYCEKELGACAPNKPDT